MKYFKKIEGERVYLSPIHHEDAEIFCKWLNDRSVSDGINKTKDLVTIEDEKKWIENLDGKNDYNFSIIEKENNIIIGNCTIRKIDHIGQHAELGILIGEEENRNKGYGKEVIELLLNYGFNELNLHSIELSALSFNERAINCYKKSGFKEVGRIRESLYNNGKRYDIVILDILKDEFNNLNHKNKQNVWLNIKHFYFTKNFINHLKPSST